MLGWMLCFRTTEQPKSVNDFPILKCPLSEDISHPIRHKLERASWSARPQGKALMTLIQLQLLQKNAGLPSTLHLLFN